MKRVFTLLLFLPILLSGCSKSSSAASSPSSAVQETTPPTETVGPAITLCTASTPEGYYNCGNYSGDGSLLSYLDYSTMTESPLCTLPGCTHNSDSCPAFYPLDGETRPFGVLVAGDHLLVIQPRAIEGTVPHIELLDLDGSRQGCLARFSENQILPEVLDTSYYTDGENLYFELLTSEPEGGRRTSSLMELSLSDGSVRTLYEISDTIVHMEPIASFDRFLVVYTAEGPYTSQTVLKHFLLDVDTGCRQELEWPESDLSWPSVNDRYLWFISPDSGLLTRKNLIDGSQVTKNIQDLTDQVGAAYGGPDRIIITPLSFTTDDCILTFGVPHGPDGKYTVSYSLPLGDEDPVPFDLETPEFGLSFLPVTATTPYGLLVRCGYEDETVLDSQGNETVVVYDLWALISQEDYLHSNPNWIATAQLSLEPK